MFFVKHRTEIFSILLISIFYCAKSSPVILAADNSTNGTEIEDTFELDDLIIEIDFSKGEPTIGKVDDEEDIALGSGDGEIFLDLKFPLDESLKLNESAITGITEETMAIGEQKLDDKIYENDNSTQVEASDITNYTKTDILFDNNLNTTTLKSIVTNDTDTLFQKQNTSINLNEEQFNSTSFEMEEDLINSTDSETNEHNENPIIEATKANELTTASNCPSLICHSTTFLSRVVDYDDIYEMYAPPGKCNYGRKKNNETGCNTCECAKNPEQSGEDICIEPLCLKPCYYGSLTDENGCNTCACKTRPLPKSVFECPALDCPTCDYGSIKVFELVKYLKSK